jgi:hypothetical protein
MKACNMRGQYSVLVAKKWISSSNEALATAETQPSRHEEPTKQVAPIQKNEHGTLQVVPVNRS